MDVLIIHNIIQAQFREDLNQLFTKEFKLKQDKDIGYYFHKYFAFKGRINDIKSLSREVKKVISGNYYFNHEDKMILYFIDQKTDKVPRLKKKKII